MLDVSYRNALLDLAGSPLTLLYAAGLTSHASVNVMLALEDAFDLEFPERLLKKATFSSLGSIVEAIDEIRVDA